MEALLDIEALLDTPLAWRLAAVALAGAVVGSWANAAIYHWAWDRRLVSPWQPTPAGVALRGWLDRVPVVGWLRLRRDAGVLGRGFWVRPLLLELAFAVGGCALYVWEVQRLGLIEPQVRFGPPLDAAPLAAVLHLQFFAHAALATLMAIATFIDIDEKTIPDLVTRPGTLLGLALVALAPLALPPVVAESAVAPASGVRLMLSGGAPAVGPAGDPLWLAPAHVTSPLPWPATLGGGRWPALALGLGCWGLWVFAVADRRWPTRGRPAQRIALWNRRFRRDLLGSALRWLAPVGAAGVVAGWLVGGPTWQGLLSALVGMVASGGVVWGVRIVGSAVLGREAMGFGDVTLMMMVGAFVGWQAGLVAFFLAPFAGVFIALANYALRRDDAIPYGPFLCAATLFVVVRWADVWRRAEPLLAMGWLLPVVLVVCLALLGGLLALLQGVKRLAGWHGQD